MISRTNQCLRNSITYYSVLLLAELLLPLAGLLGFPHPTARKIIKVTIPNPKNCREKLLFIVCFIFVQKVDAVVSNRQFRIRLFAVFALDSSRSRSPSFRLRPSFASYSARQSLMVVLIALASVLPSGENIITSKAGQGARNNPTPRRS